MKIILTETQIRRILEQFDYSDAMKLEKVLVDHYGTTEDYGVAGFITPSGYLLDFSAGGSGSRGQDHRNISHFMDELGYNTGDRTDAVMTAQKMGFIRFSPESNGFDMLDMPTQEQFQVLRQLIRQMNGSVILDLDTGVFIQYDAGTPVDKVIMDIKNYYTRGMKPQPYQYADEDELYESLIQRIINKL